jgi:hypothetical protein
MCDVFYCVIYKIENEKNPKWKWYAKIIVDGFLTKFSQVTDGEREYKITTLR